MDVFLWWHFLTSWENMSYAATVFSLAALFIVIPLIQRGRLRHQKAVDTADRMETAKIEHMIADELKPIDEHISNIVREFQDFREKQAAINAIVKYIERNYVHSNPYYKEDDEEKKSRRRT